MRLRAFVSVLALLAALPVPAAILSVTGSGNILVPTAAGDVGMTADFFQDTGADILIHGWNEAQGQSLTSGISVDITAPGTYNSATFTTASAMIPAGTLVSSHYFYFDPLGSATRTATFEFDGDILGVIVCSEGTLCSGIDRLFASDSLRNPFATAPAAHFNLRGAEFGPEEITVSADLRSLTLNLTASTPGDQVRVITVSEIPEPRTGLMMLGGLAAGLGLAHRRGRRLRT